MDRERGRDRGIDVVEEPKERVAQGVNDDRSHAATAGRVEWT